MAPKNSKKTVDAKKGVSDNTVTGQRERSAALSDLASLAELDPTPDADIDDDLQRLASAAAPSSRYAQLPEDAVDDLGGWSDVQLSGVNAGGPDSAEVDQPDRSDDAP